MATFSREQLKAAAQALIQAGAIEWSVMLERWSTCDLKPLTQEEVDALCVAHLTAETERAKKKRGGRPVKKESEKLKCVSAMVSVRCYDELHARAEEFGMTLSLLLRRMLDKPNSFRVARATQRSLTPDDQRMWRQLTGATGSLYQLAQRASEQGMSEVEEEVLTICRDLRAILNR